VIIDAEEDRLLVISDLHLGNPSSTARTRLVEFLDYARITNTSVCINGDGFEMLQTSFSRLSADAVPVLNALRRLMRDGNRVYYLVGNHDISLEHFLEDWLFTQIAPFLNLRSGDARIRIEHGHLYDPWFVRYPKSYEYGARVLGLALLVHPDVYSAYATVQTRAAARRKGDPPDEVAAEMLLARGFDTVIFGHTHNARDVQLANGHYVNSGNWLRGSSYVEIDNGKVELKKWESWRASERP
jgi:UDP-2,3-diacylglucosamine pyrophosphatase LpxH